MTKILFLHGLESGPYGGKYHTLVDAGYEVAAPDMRGDNLTTRVEKATELLEKEPMIVVGSSYGGVTAVLSAMRANVTIPGMVLCAPALERDEEPNTPLQLNVLCPTIIVHGKQDEVIPLEVSRRFVERNSHVKLVEVQDGHRLSNSMTEILTAVSQLTQT